MRIVFILVLSLGLYSGCNRSPADTPRKAEPLLEVKTTRLFRGPITRSIILPAEIKAYQETTLYAKVAGYLKSITVDKGDQVKAGELIADIEVPELLADQETTLYAKVAGNLKSITVDKGDQVK